MNVKILFLPALILAGGAIASAQQLASPSFILTVRTGTPQQVERAIKSGAKVEAHDKNGISILMFAVAYNPDATVTRELLAAGASIKDRDGVGNTPLIWAAAGNSNTEVLRLLLAAGASVGERNVHGDTPLMWAAGALGGNPNAQITKFLIAEHSPINARDNRGMTALMLAAEWNTNPEVVGDLLAAGANAKLRSDAGKTALDYAEQNAHLVGTPAFDQLKRAAT